MKKKRRGNVKRDRTWMFRKRQVANMRKRQDDLVTIWECEMEAGREHRK